MSFPEVIATQEAEDDDDSAGAEDGSLYPDDSLHAMNATTAAFHADIAAKHACHLAQWVHYLSGTLGHLQNQVSELEDWKRGALEEVRKLKDDHRVLVRAVAAKEGADTVSVSASASSSDGLSPPVGLALTAPPTPTLVHDFSMDSIATPPAFSPSTSPSFGNPQPDVVAVAAKDAKEDGVQVNTTMVDGVEFQHAEWKIANLSLKLRGCMGRALVSPPFSALGMEDLRLMIYADAKDQGQGTTRNRRQKEQYAKMITEGPLDARLSLKIPNCPDGCILKCYYSMGSHRLGPFTHDFSQSTVSECDEFGVDWLKELDAERGLILSVDLLRPPSDYQ